MLTLLLSLISLSDTTHPRVTHQYWNGWNPHNQTDTLIIANTSGTTYQRGDTVLFHYWPQGNTTIPKQAKVVGKKAVKDR